MHSSNTLRIPLLRRVFQYSRSLSWKKELHMFNWKDIQQISKSQKVKSQKVYFSTFQFFEIQKDGKLKMGICWDTEYSIKRSYTCRDCTVGWPSLFQNHSSLKYWCFGVCHSVFLFWLKKWRNGVNFCWWFICDFSVELLDW